MKRKWLELAARFDALARRERGMVAAALLVGGGFLAYTLLVEPQLLRYTNQVKRLAQAGSDLSALEAQLAAVQVQLKDPDAANRAALLQGRKDLAALDAKLRSIENSMVPPEKMQGFLATLLSKNHSLELLALRTLPPTGVIEPVEEKKEEKPADGKGAAPTAAPVAPPARPAAAPNGTPNIYKHGVEIRIAGSYNDLLMYLNEIERMPQRIIWNRVVLATDKYPRNEMTLTVYTLSLDKQWLVV